MMPTEKISLQQFKKTEKDVIGGLCRCVARRGSRSSASQRELTSCPLVQSAACDASDAARAAR